MEDACTLVLRATAPEATPAERHAAFGGVVERFQDMAFACAYAVLGDFHLAEDASQEAFITAWRKLDCLREPRAFPGWFRRIVLTECNRLTRGKRVTFVPLDDAEDAPSGDPGPDVVAENRELGEKVSAAIRALPEGERMATMLFYVAGYTQADIGAFLEVPAMTVGKRLHSARRRLRGSLVGTIGDDLRGHRLSRDGRFADRVDACLRPFAERDWPRVTALASDRDPGAREGSGLWLRGRRAFDESRYVRRHYVAEHAHTGQALGYGSIEQSIYLPAYRLSLVVAERWLRAGVGDLLFERLDRDLREVGALSVRVTDFASQTDLVAFLEDRGFAETATAWELRLDLEGADPARFENAREAAAALGVAVTTLAEEREHAPDYLERIHDLVVEAGADDPARRKVEPAAFDAREARLWLEQPYMLPDAYFLAKRGDRYVGVAYLTALDAAPGEVSLGFLGVRREWRGRGLATALAACCVERARREGRRAVRAVVRPAQAAALAATERLGFRRRLRYVTLEKVLKDVVAVGPDILDRYAGTYRHVDADRSFELVVRNEGGQLTAEFAGQKVELYPESETEFFVKQFYGRAEFVVDEGGDAVHLVWRERDREQVEREMRARRIA